MKIEFNGDERAERLKCKIEEFMANHDKQGRRIKRRKYKSYDEAAASLKGRLRKKSKEFRG